jgi:hypothetical protein
MSNSVFRKVSRTVFNFLTEKDKFLRYRDVDEEIAIRLEDSIIRFESVKSTGDFVERDQEDQDYIKELLADEIKEQENIPISELLAQENSCFIEDSENDDLSHIVLVRS